MKANEKTIWVTGASSGIGRALAVNLSRRGARLILWARSAQRLEDCRQACMNPERHVVLPLDLTDASSLEQAPRQVLEKCGSIDILINNGGIGQRSLVADTRLEVDRRIMEVNFFGAERNEVYMGGKEKLGVYLQRFVPDLFGLIIRSKAKVR